MYQIQEEQHYVLGEAYPLHPAQVDSVMYSAMLNKNLYMRGPGGSDYMRPMFPPQRAIAPQELPSDVSHDPVQDPDVSVLDFLNLSEAVTRVTAVANAGFQLLCGLLVVLGKLVSIAAIYETVSILQTLEPTQVFYKNNNSLKISTSNHLLTQLVVFN